MRIRLVACAAAGAGALLACVLWLRDSPSAPSAVPPAAELVPGPSAAVADAGEAAPKRAERIKPSVKRKRKTPAHRPPPRCPLPVTDEEGAARLRADLFAFLTGHQNPGDNRCRSN